MSLMEGGIQAEPAWQLMSQATSCAPIQNLGAAVCCLVLMLTSRVHRISVDRWSDVYGRCSGVIDLLSEVSISLEI